MSFQIKSSPLPTPPWEAPWDISILSENTVGFVLCLSMLQHSLFNEGIW